jgi:predicted enzyme related to lactoylglutathione lyase
MAPALKTIIYPVSDLATAKAVFGAFLGAPVIDQAYYVQFESEGQAIGLDPHGHGKDMTGPVPYWHVDDIEAGVKALVDAGAEVKQAIREVGGGRRIATLVDGDGNPIGLLQD